jgi:hypothetical protein
MRLTADREHFYANPNCNVDYHTDNHGIDGVVLTIIGRFGSVHVREGTGDKT